MMNNAFEMEVSRITALGEDCLTPWETLDAALKALTTTRAHTPEERQTVDRLRQSIINQRLSCFEQRYEEARAQIASGDINNLQRLNRIIIELTQVAKPHAVQAELGKLRDELRDRGQVNELRRKVDYWIDKYNEHVRAGMDLVEAKIEYLDKAQEAVERARATAGNAEGLADIVEDVNRAIRDADKTPLHTMVTQQRFEEIINQLELRPPNYEEVLIDAYGKYYEKRRRDDAIGWYRDRAVEFATDKAQKYLEEARQLTGRGLPITAKDRASAVNSLYLVPEKLKQRAMEYINNVLQPILDNIDRARARLHAVLSAPDLDTALRYYREALDPTLGYPNFRTIAEQERAASRDDDENYQDDFTEARQYLLTGMEKRLKTCVALLNPQSPLWLPASLSDQELKRLDDYLEFENAALRETYGLGVLQLKNAYNRQVERGRLLENEADRAVILLEKGQYDAAYNVLNPFVDILNTFPDTFSREYGVWNIILAYRGRAEIFQLLRTRLEAGVTTRPFSEQADEVKALIERADQAKQTPLEGVTDEEWNRRIRYLRDLLRLIEGEQFFQDRHFSDARRVWADIGVEVPDIYNRAQRRINDADSRMQDDHSLDQALQRAENFIKTKRLWNALDELSPHEMKVATRNYAQLVTLLTDVRAALSDEIAAKIEDNIARAPEDPTELLHLSRELEQLDKQRRADLDQRIDGAIRLQTAKRDLNDARGTTQANKWRRALTSWQGVDDADAALLAEIRIAYMEAIAREALARVDQEMDPSRRSSLLTRALRDIDEQGRDLQQDTITRGLRFIILVRQAEMAASPQEVRTLINSARTEYHNWKPADDDPDLNKLVIEFDQRAIIILNLAQTADSVQNDLKLSESLLAWKNARERWDNNLTQLHIDVGLRAWYENVVKAQARVELEERLKQLPQPWQRCDIYARQVLVLDTAAPGDLATYFNSLRNAANNLRAETLARSLDFTDQEALAREMQNAALAVIFLCDHVVFNLPLPPDYEPVDPLAVEAKALILMLVRAEDEFKRLNEQIRFAHDTLKAVSSTGEFDRINDVLADFRDGPFRDYQQHRAVREIMDDAARTEHEYQTYRALADRAQEAFLNEDFNAVLELLQKLDTDEAKAYGSFTMVNVDDPFGKRVTNTLQTRAAINGKLDQINALVGLLNGLIDPAPLLRYVRGDESVILIDELHLVNLDKVQAAVIVNLNEARYQDAGRHVRRARNGAVAPDAPPLPYDQDVLSLQGANDILVVFFNNTQPDGLSSHTARSIYDCVLEIQEIVKAGLQRADDLLAEVDRLKREFERLQREIMDASSALDTGIFNFHRKREPLLTKLRDAYQQLRGYPKTPDAPPPIAPNYVGLDVYYEKYRQEIESKLG